MVVFAEPAAGVPVDGTVGFLYRGDRQRREQHPLDGFSTFWRVRLPDSQEPDRDRGVVAQRGGCAHGRWHAHLSPLEHYPSFSRWLLLAGRHLDGVANPRPWREA